MKRIKIFLVVMCAIILCGCAKSQEQYSKEITNVVEKYNNGDISYDEATSKLNSLYDNADSEMRAKIDDERTLLDKLKESKDAFASAQNASNVNNYKLSIKSYADVIAEDTNYEKAQQAIVDDGNKYLDEVHKLGETYISEDKYTKAISAYKDSKDVYDDGSADTWIADTESQYKQNVEAKIEKCVSDGDYQTAIIDYNELYDYFKDETYNVKIAELENEWVNKVVAESEQYLSNGDYKNAKDALAAAKRSIKNDEELDAQEARVEEFTPVNLFSLDSFAETTGQYVSVKNWSTGDKTNTGNSGYVGKKVSILENMGIGDITDYRYKAIYNIDGNYDTLTGLFAIDFDSKDCTADNFGAQFFVLADEQDILYKSDWIRGGDMPLEINLDISGRNQVSVGVFVVNFMNGGHLTYTEDFSVGLCDLYLNKTYVPKETNVDDTSSEAGNGIVPNENE